MPLTSLGNGRKIPHVVRILGLMLYKPAYAVLFGRNSPSSCGLATVCDLSPRSRLMSFNECATTWPASERLWPDNGLLDIARLR